MTYHPYSFYLLTSSPFLYKRNQHSNPGKMILWNTSPSSSPSAGFLNKVTICCPNHSSLDLLPCRVMSSMSLDSVTITVERLQEEGFSFLVPGWLSHSWKKDFSPLTFFMLDAYTMLLSLLCICHMFSESLNSNMAVQPKTLQTCVLAKVATPCPLFSAPTMGTQLVLRSWSSNEQLPDLYPIHGLPRPNMGALDSCRGCCFSFRDGNTTGVPQLPVGSLIPSDSLPTSLGSVLPWRVASTALIQIPYGPGLPPAVLSRLCPPVHLP